MHHVKFCAVTADTLSLSRYRGLGFILSTIFTCIIYAPRLVQESFGPEKYNTFNFSCNESQPFCCIISQNIGHAEALMSMVVQTITEN